MFSIQQIKEAHSKVKSGADFPKYIQDLIMLDVRSYDTFVRDGHAEYRGDNDYEIQSEAKYPTLTVATKSDNEQFQKILKNHQQGGSDYLTFCSQSAETGVEKWTVDTRKMRCTYYDKQGNGMLEEVIPQV